MNAADLIAEAQAAGLQLHVLAADRLKWRCEGDPPPDLLDRIRAFKSEVLAALAIEQAANDDQAAADRLYEFEERAAIMEFGAGMSRNEAEAAAREELGYDS